MVTVDGDAGGRERVFCSYFGPFVLVRVTCQVYVEEWVDIILLYCTFSRQELFERECSLVFYEFKNYLRAFFSRVFYFYVFKNKKVCKGVFCRVCTAEYPGTNPVLLNTSLELCVFFPGVLLPFFQSTTPTRSFRPASVCWRCQRWLSMRSNNTFLAAPCAPHS